MDIILLTWALVGLGLGIFAIRKGFRFLGGFLVFPGEFIFLGALGDLFGVYTSFVPFFPVIALITYLSLFILAVREWTNNHKALAVALSLIVLAGIAEGLYVFFSLAVKGYLFTRPF